MFSSFYFTLLDLDDFALDVLFEWLFLPVDDLLTFSVVYKNIYKLFKKLSKFNYTKLNNL